MWAAEELSERPNTGWSKWLLKCSAFSRWHSLLQHAWVIVNMIQLHCSFDRLLNLFAKRWSTFFFYHCNMCNDASVQLRGWELSHAGLRDGERTFQDVNLRCWFFFSLSFVIFWCEGGAAPSGTAATLLDRWCWGRGGGREERVDGRQGSFSCQASAAVRLVGGGGAISQHHGCSSRIRVEFRRRPIKQLISVHFCQTLKGRNASDVLIFSSLYLCLPLFYCHVLNPLRLHTFYFPCVYNHVCQETLSSLGSNGHR